MKITYFLPFDWLQVCDTIPQEQLSSAKYIIFLWNCQFLQHPSPSPLTSCMPHNFIAPPPTKAWSKINVLTLTVLHQVFVALGPPWIWWILSSHSPWKSASLQLHHATLFSLWVVPSSPLESNRRGAINSRWRRFLVGTSSLNSSTEASAGKGLGQVKHKCVLPWRRSYIFFRLTWHCRDMPEHNPELVLLSFSKAQEVFHYLFFIHQSHWFIDISILRKCLDSLVGVIPSII